mmetsp:Transcript_65210/g.155731  ORF Transcript_65210/g.155731 Transcript_65210/m.155731 type:complete len:690 (+) Transcript_65210:70-2139(+)
MAAVEEVPSAAEEEESESEVDDDELGHLVERQEEDTDAEWLPISLPTTPRIGTDPGDDEAGTELARQEGTEVGTHERNQQAEVHEHHERNQLPQPHTAGAAVLGAVAMAYMFSKKSPSAADQSAASLVGQPSPLNSMEGGEADASAPGMLPESSTIADLPCNNVDQPADMAGSSSLALADGFHGQHWTEPRRLYRCLLLGQTGSGKTLLFALLKAWVSLGSPIGDLRGTEWLEALRNPMHSQDNEAGKEESMGSQTKFPLRYESIDMGDFDLEVIDTPGFGDTRGPRYDEEHVAQIVESLQQVESLNSIILVINGREARMTKQLSYVLCQISSIMPKTVLQQIVVVFTNTQAEMDLNFQIDTLKDFVGDVGIEKRYVCLENPMASLCKRDLEEHQVAALAARVSSSFSALSQLAGMVQGQEDVFTKEFSELFDSRQEVEKQAMNLLAEYQRVSELVEEGRREEDKLHAVMRQKLKNRDYRKTRKSVKHYTVKANRVMTLCRHPGCHSNCGMPRILRSESSSRRVVLENTVIDARSGNCIKCGHPASAHIHALAQWVEDQVVEPLTDNSKLKQFMAARSEEEKQRVLVDGLKAKLRERQEQQERIIEEFVRAVEDYERISTRGIFKMVLENQLEVLDHALQSSTSEVEARKGGDSQGTPQEDHRALAEARRKLAEKLRAVNDALTKRSRL